MDHRGLRARLVGADCTSCGATVADEGIVVLADRGDVAFVELACGACGSRTLSVVLADSGDVAALDTARHPELDPATEVRVAGAPALVEDDVESMRRLLDAWDGDLRGLLDGGSA